jgi:hypothetical protein
MDAIKRYYASERDVASYGCSLCLLAKKAATDQANCDHR